jgi:hypothetical protein
MRDDREEGEGRAGLGAGMGGTTGGTLGGAKREAMDEASGEGGEGDAPKLSAAEIDDRTPDPVRDGAVAQVTPDQLQANPRADDGPAGPAGGTLSGG